MFITAKASDDGADSAFLIDATFNASAISNDKEDEDDDDDEKAIINEGTRTEYETVKEIVQLEEDDEDKEGVTIILLIILVVVGTLAVIVICLYNRKKLHGGCCPKKIPEVTKKNPGRINPAANG